MVIVAVKCTTKVDSDKPIALLTAALRVPCAAIDTPAKNDTKRKKMSLPIDNTITLDLDYLPRFKIIL
jgi:hypothetical protein